MSDETLSVEQIRERMLDHAGINITFDGFSETAFAAIARDADVSLEQARLAFPDGMRDLGVEMHFAGDRELATAMQTDLSHLRYSERVAYGVMLRLDIAGRDKEATRQASSFFALPINAASASKCIWNTADTIWTALGDTSDDLNWYSKRAILSGVYSASFLYWLGDESPNSERTRAFVDRRIANVMQFEKAKAGIKKSRAYEAFRKGPGRILDQIKAPSGERVTDLPGFWRK